MVQKVSFLMALGCFFFWPLLAALAQDGAHSPMAAIKTNIDEGIAILRDPAYKNPEKHDEQRTKIWGIVREVFDFTEVAKRALAQNWRKFTPIQRKEFTEAFADLLGETYMDKLQSHYHNETVEFLGEKKLGPEKAVIKSLIVRESVKTPVDYRVRLKNGKWQVYDVIVEGVSLVKNYRSQFNEILFNEKPADLIKKLQKKIEDKKSGKAEQQEEAFMNQAIKQYMQCGGGLKNDGLCLGVTE